MYREASNMLALLVAVSTQATSAVSAEPAFVLDLESAAPVAVQAFANRSLSSWGGNVAKAADGSFHLFAAAMTGGCNLGNWKTNSEVIHGVSDSALGPFRMVSVALPRWHHNPGD